MCEIILCNGFTDSLLDKACNEIFLLMKQNTWPSFRRTMLRYSGDDTLAAKRKQKSMAKTVFFNLFSFFYIFFCIFTIKQKTITKKRSEDMQARYRIWIYFFRYFFRYFFFFIISKQIDIWFDFQTAN